MTDPDKTPILNTFSSIPSSPPLMFLKTPSTQENIYGDPTHDKIKSRLLDELIHAKYLYKYYKKEYKKLKKECKKYNDE